MTENLKPEDMEKRIKALENELDKYKKENNELKELHNKCNTIINNANEAILVIQEGKLKLVNNVAAKIAGYSKKETPDKFFLEWVHPDDKKMVIENHLKRLDGEKVPDDYDIRVIDKKKKVRWMSIRPIVIEWERQPAMLVFMTDISKRKEIEEEKEELIFELQGAFSKINAMKGYLPICPSCKKIRDDKGSWNQIEAYMHDHSEAEFCHAFCPECSKNRDSDWNVDEGK